MGFVYVVIIKRIKWKERNSLLTSLLIEVSWKDPTFNDIVTSNFTTTKEPYEGLLLPNQGFVRKNWSGRVRVRLVVVVGVLVVVQTPVPTSVYLHVPKYNYLCKNVVLSRKVIFTFGLKLHNWLSLSVLD